MVNIPNKPGTQPPNPITLPEGEELGSLENLWELVLDTVPDAMMILDRHYHIVRINKAGADRFHLKRKSTIDRPCYELMHGLSEPPANCPFTRLLADGQQREVEATIEELNGTFHVTVVPILDAKRKIVGAVHTARDISGKIFAEESAKAAAAELELKVAERTVELYAKNQELIAEIAQRELAEKNLTKSEQRFRDVAEILPQFIFEINCTGFVTYANRASMQALGVSDDDLAKGLFCLNLVVPEHVSYIADDIRKVLKGEIVGGREYFVKRKDGAALPVVVHIVAMKEDGNIVGVRGVGMDVSEQKKREQELRESRRKLATLIGNLPGMVYRCRNDETRTIEFVSEGCKQLTGYSPEDLVDNTTIAFGSLVHPNDVAKVRNRIKKGVAERTPIEMTYRILTAWSGERWVSERAMAVLGEDGNLTAIEGCLHDITAQRRAEAALRKAAANLARAQHIARLGSWEWDIITNELYGSDEFYRILGLPRARFGLTFDNLLGHVPTEDRELVERAVEAALHEGKPFHIEHRVVVPWGPERVVKQIGEAIFDSRGRPIQMTGTAQDVTDRARAERELKDSERKMRQIIESFPIGVTIIRDEKYDFVNSAFVKMFGYESPCEIVGLAVDALYEPQDRAAIKTQVETSVVHAGTAPCFERRGLKRDGTAFEVTVWLRAMEKDGKPAVLGLFIDVSEAKALRAQLLQCQKKEAIGTLAGGIAHDFNNLLTVIAGYTELLLMNKNQEDPVYEDLQKVGSAAARGAELVERLMTFSRTDKFTPRALNINYEVEQVVKLISRTIPKMIAIETDLVPHIKIVSVDAGQTEQVLLNLVLNAKDAMPDGGTLRFETRNVVVDEEMCQTHPEATCGEYVEVTISDTGAGMEKEILDHVFEPFFTTKAPGRGTGLGLATVHGIVKQHSGFITCTSQPGQGTSFRIYLPVHHIEAFGERKVEQSTPQGGRETILLVDDEELICQLSRKVLEHVGYTVLIANNGEEALELYRQEHHRISLVLLDLIMPKMGGRQCIKELKAVNPAAKVLITSGYSSKGKAADMAEMGALGFVRKPHMASELLRKVREALDAR